MSDLESRLRSSMHDETIDISARSSLADDMIARGTKVRRRRRIAGGVAALAVLAAVIPVWHNIESSGSRVVPTSPTDTSTSIPGPSQPRTVLPSWGSRPVAVEDHTDGSSRVVDLRVGRHATYDRIVVDLTGPITGYRVRYVAQFIPPEGDPVALPGDKVLMIQLTSTAAHDDSGHVLLQGGPRQTYGLPAVLGSTYTDYEGYVSFGFGLAEATDFRVFPLTSPTRLVIDVRH